MPGASFILARNPTIAGDPNLPPSPAPSSARPNPQPLAYRPEVDGLRALAVLPVMLFHAGFEWMAGGFVGVDVFFVISGFLITSIILRERQAGQFSLLRFYERRARRILPALFAVMAACLPFAWLWMTAGQLREFGHSLIAVPLFAANLLFWRSSDYFAAAAEEKPLLHTWSLGVEEQYYLFFPPLILMLWRFGLARVTALVALAALGSLALSEWSASRFQAANFYLPHTRAWELLLGSLLAFLSVREPLHRRLGEGPGPALACNLLAALGLALIVAALATLERSTPFPGIHALAPTLGTALILGFGHGGTWVGRLLSLRGIVAIGLVSYSAYLWHQPLFAFARLYSPNAPDGRVLALLCLATLALAGLSWRFVEQPFRDRSRVSRRGILLFGTLGSLLFITAGTALHLSGGFPERSGQQVRQLFQELRHTKDEMCGGEVDRDAPPTLHQCTAGDPTAPVSVAVLGDSHAEALYWAIGRELATRNRRGNLLTYSGCPPILDTYRADKDASHRCRQYNSAVFELVTAAPGVDTLILAARWTLYLENTPFDNVEGGLEPAQDGSLLAPADAGEKWRDDDSLRRRLVAEHIRATVTRYLATGKTLVLVYPVPEAGWHVPNLMARHLARGEMPAGGVSTDHGRFLARNRATIAALDAIPDHPRLVRVRPDALLCDSLIPDRCALALEGRPLYFDEDHLSLKGAALVAAEIARLLDGPTGDDRGSTGP